MGRRSSKAAGVDFLGHGLELLHSLDLLSIRPEKEIHLDPIADIFSTLQVTAVVHSRLEATAPWGLMREAHVEEKALPSGKRISPTELAHFGMVSRGNCWLSVDGILDPIPLTGGDCFLLAPRTSFVLRDQPNTRPRSFCEVAPKGNTNVAHYGGGGTPTTIVSGFLSFDSASLKPITQLLPSLILIKADEAQTRALHSTLHLLASEMEVQMPGSEVVANRLAEILFIQTLRAHIASGAESYNQGWLRAIFDPQIGAALRAVHANVNNPWGGYRPAAAKDAWTRTVAFLNKELKLASIPRSR